MILKHYKMLYKTLSNKIFLTWDVLSRPVDFVDSTHLCFWDTDISRLLIYWHFGGEYSWSGIGMLHFFFTHAIIQDVCLFNIWIVWFLIDLLVICEFSHFLEFVTWSASRGNYKLRYPISVLSTRYLHDCKQNNESLYFTIII